MNEIFQAILDSLPPKPSRSRLEPYAELIHELRKRGRSYREIAGILDTRCGIRIGVHTLYNFVRVRTVAPKKVRAEKATGTTGRPVESAAAATQAGTGQDAEVWKRIRALKERPPAAGTPGAEKVFHYDENVPLTRLPQKKDEV